MYTSDSDNTSLSTTIPLRRTDSMTIDRRYQIILREIRESSISPTNITRETTLKNSSLNLPKN